jgi:hypothetical protein
VVHGGACSCFVPDSVPRQEERCQGLRKLRAHLP